MNQFKNNNDPSRVDYLQDQLPAFTRRQLLIRVLLFQFRLLIDGTRDLVLSPISLIALILDLLSTDRRRGQYFQMLCFWGHKSDQWINLFGHSELDVIDENKL